MKIELTDPELELITRLVGVNADMCRAVVKIERLTKAKKRSLIEKAEMSERCVASIERQMAASSS